MTEAVVVLALLLVGHAVADSLLQPGALSVAKRSPDWWTRWQALGVHATAHGFFVLLVTGGGGAGLGRDRAPRSY